MVAPKDPVVTVTQPKVAFILSLITLAGLVYAGTEKYIRREVEFETVQENQARIIANYETLLDAQKDLKTEVKSLRETIDGEIRYMTTAINRLSGALEEEAVKRKKIQ